MAHTIGAQQSSLFNSYKAESFNFKTWKYCRARRMLHSEVTPQKPKHNRCWPQKHIWTRAEKEGETLKKGRSRSTTALRKRKWGKTMIYCFSVRWCLSLTDPRTQRDVLQAACPTGSRVFSELWKPKLRGLKDRVPFGTLSWKRVDNPSPPLPPSGHAAATNTNMPKIWTSFPQLNSAISIFPNHHLY